MADGAMEILGCETKVVKSNSGIVKAVVGAVAGLLSILRSGM